MREVIITYENYQKVRSVSKFNEETISEPLKDEKDHLTELYGIILQKLSLCLNFDCYISRQPIHERIYPKVNNKNDFRSPKHLDYVPRTNTCSFDGMIGD